MAMFDTHMLLTILGIALIGGLIGLDRTAAGQFMISQPIVIAPLTGWLLNDPTAGVVIGVALELIWVLDLPVGTFVPANSTISAVFATTVAALGTLGPAPLSVMGFSLLLTVGLAPVTMRADTVVRKWNSRLGDAAVSGSGEYAGRRLSRAHLFGLVLFFFKSFLLYLIVLPIGIAAVLVFNQAPDVFHRAMSLFVKLLPLLGVAVIARKLSVKHIDAFLLSGAVIAVLMGQAFHAPVVVIIFLTIMGGLLGALYSERHG